MVIGRKVAEWDRFRERRGEGRRKSVRLKDYTNLLSLIA